MSDAFEIQGVEEFRQRLGRMGNEKQIARVATNAIRRGARRIAAATRKEMKGRGVVQRVFRGDADGLGKLVHAHRPEVVGGIIQCKITVKGLAAIQETGGRTAAHSIGPKTAGKLAFVTHGRLVVTPNPVMHPGATHPKMPVFGAQFQAGQASTLEDVRASFEAFITKAWDRG